MENLSERYRLRGAVLVGIAASYNSICLSPFQFKSCAMSDPDLRRIWDLKVIHHPHISADARAMRVPLLIEQIERHEPELVCVTCDPWSRAIVADMIPALRGFLTRVDVVCGVLDCRSPLARTGEGEGEKIAADYFIPSDGEHAFVDLLRHLTYGAPALDAIEGLAVRDAKRGGFRIEPRRTSPRGILDIPPPYSSGAASEEVFAWPRMQAAIESHRGHQPGNCDSVERTMREVRYCVTKGVRDIRFVDADFAADPRHAKAIVHALLRERIASAIECAVAPESLDEELASLLGAYARLYAENEVTVCFDATATAAAACHSTIALVKRHGLITKIALTAEVCP